MIKKVILLIILIGIIGGVITVVLTTKKSSVQTGTLSERSQAFIDEQKKNNQSDWRFARLDKESDKAGSFVGKRVEVGDCFSFVMVFRVTNPREDGECNWYFGIEKPKGFITAYILSGSAIHSVDQIDGVSMRQRSPEKYSEERRMINGVEYLLYKSKSGQYEANAFALLNGKPLIFNLITTSPDTYDKELNAMLGSIEARE